MYIAFEGTDDLLKEKFFLQSIEFYKNKNESFEVFHPLEPMPSYVWWEQVYSNYAKNKFFTSELLVSRAKYHLRNAKLNSQRLIGVGSIFANLVENWPEKHCLVQAHVRNLLNELKPIPVPDKVIYIVKNSDLDVYKHQRYLHIFENLKQYGLDSMKIYYLNEKELESNSVNSCDPLLEILMSTR